MRNLPRSRSQSRSWMRLSRPSVFARICAGPFKFQTGAGLRSLPLHLPYDIMEYLLSKCQLSLKPELLRDFWQHLDRTNDAWASQSRAWRMALGSKPVWPLGLYGDEACIGLQNSPYSKVFGLWMSIVLFRPRSTRLGRFLLFSIENDRIVTTEQTLFPVLELIKDSCNRLTRDGINGIHCCVSEIRGDQLFFKQILRHNSWWKSSNVCFRCRANISDSSLNYAHYCVPGGWQETIRTTEEFLQEELPLEVCYLAPSVSAKQCLPP